METDDDEEVVRFQYEGDPRIYDSGKMLNIAYRRNENDPDCVENKIFNSEGVTEVDALLQVYPDFPPASFFYDTATRVTLETIDGELKAIVTEDLDAIISYLPIPPSLSHIPTVPIAELEKIDMENIMDTDRVKWRGDTYAFKRTGVMIEGTLRELAIMDQLAESPNIIDLVAIVVNHDSTIRGFLTPFMRSGDLQSVFEDARKIFGLGDDDDATAFDWPLKLSWARQIAQAVVELHDISAYNGNLKPQSVLIDSTGQAKLIDFLPMLTSDEFAAPELLKRFQGHGITFESVLTTPADVYSLGLVLWAVAEETWRRMPTPLWREGKTPNWYRDIVKRCLVLAPEARPSAIEVLSLLEREGA
jgi:serine/threonine protein kinase